MANALVVHKDRLPQSQKMHRAAQYVRMSTQQYSIENQAVVCAPHEQQSRLLRLRRVATVLVRLVVYIESAFVSVPGLVSAVRNGDAAQIMSRTDLPRSAIPSSIS